MASRFPAILVLSALLASAQEPIRGPMLGWVWDSQKETLRAVLGIAGSSLLGASLDLGAPVKSAAISGAQDYALVLLGDTRDPALVSLRDAQPSALPLPDVPSGASRVDLSPPGDSAALSYDDAKKIVLLTGLPAAPSVQASFDLSVEGMPAALAVTDDGSTLLATYPALPATLVFDSGGNRWPLPFGPAVKALAFFENSHDALLSANDGVYLAKNVSDATELTQVWSSAAAGAVAPFDAKRILIVDTDAENVLKLDLESGENLAVQCPCAPTSLTRMSGRVVFRLNEVSKGPLWLVEVQDSGLRTVFVPPDASDPDMED
ncbi:MAG: hypothetical protein IT165_25110 [Bryobacterales bacterium]|nr:hypothetical protein [Bryobacterales bacterium]